MRRTLPGVLLLWAATACEGGLQPEPACARGVCGTIEFRGAIPQATDNVFVVAYERFPETCEDLFTFQPFPPPAVPFTNPTASYALALPDGRYEWVVAVWKKEGDLTGTPVDTALLREAGHYRDPANPEQPGVVVVNGTGTDAIDFVVDFDKLRAVTDYVSCESAP